MLGRGLLRRLGSGFRDALIERWNGTSWAIVISPNASPTYNYLTSVTCTSASDCWAVGFHIVGQTNQTLIERWNGAIWTVVASPNATLGEDNALADVVCPTGSECWAVGSYYTGSVYRTLVERWDGAAWSIIDSPNTSPTASNFLYAVACVSGATCRAVGIHANGDAYQSLTESWDGTAWAVVPSPNLKTMMKTSNALNGVNCVSASDCWNVGFYHNGSVEQTLIQRWNGTSWTIMDSPSTSPAHRNFLRDVTCTSASDCWAIGSYRTGGVDQTLIERWDGNAWAIVASPNTSPVQNNYLNRVTCASAQDCWAVGYAKAGNATQTLIERWNGTSWVIVSSPNALPGNLQNSFLTAVTCTSPSNCWAVGGFDLGNVRQTLIERWDGNSWAVIASPNTGNTQNNLLNGVACTSVSECWAVGYGRVGSADQTLIERWNGNSWSIVPSPNTSATRSNSLQNIACRSGSECSAIGFAYLGSATQTLIERWDGSLWAIVASPNPIDSPDTRLFGVTCAPGSGCWAVGNFLVDGVLATLTEYYAATSALVPTGVVSRKTHGGSPFEVDLPLTGTTGIECRTGGASGAHQVIFKFALPVSFSGASVTPATGKTAELDGLPILSPDSKEVTVNLKNVGDAQTVTIKLLGVSDGTNTGDVTIPMLVLAGDTNEDTRVNVGDTNQTKSRSGQLTDQDNFRSDVNLDGRINVGDTNFVKAHAGSSEALRAQRAR